MPQKTEYAAQPAPFEIVRSGQADAVVRMRENIAQLDPDVDGNERWEADEYELRVPWSSGLAARIAGNFAAWLDRAKEPVTKPPTTDEKIAQVDGRVEAVEDTLVGIVSDILGVEE